MDTHLKKNIYQLRPDFKRLSCLKNNLAKYIFAYNLTILINFFIKQVLKMH